ncbi:MAG: DUF1553 domain-containing protein [Planctomycetales bacterium]|nr:DUF1553 domain-containing protein [Planctomycetales bacterium]
MRLSLRRGNLLLAVAWGVLPLVLLALAPPTHHAVGAEVAGADTEASLSRAAASDGSARIDELIARGWQENDVRPASPATEGEWCRRVFLDLIGRIPTVAELDAFLAEKSPDKRAELVNRLLGGEYAGEYARSWAGIWTNLLIGRTGGTMRQSLTSREGLTDYLEAALLENMPYDQLARELLTATGDARPDMPNYNGAVNFLVEKLDEGGVQATAKTAQLMLGMGVQCTQCHNHPFNDYRQNQFWELNAFFRQTRVRVRRDDDPDVQTRYATLYDGDFLGEGTMGGRDRRTDIVLEIEDGKLVDRGAGSVRAAPIYYELRNGLVRVAFPVFVDGTALVDLFADRGAEYGNSGRIAEVNRRQELAKLILKSDEFSRALVNRMWAHFFGYGFTKPIDDMGPHNPPSHPELLDELAANFAASDYDLKELMRAIVLSRPYGLSSQISNRNADDDPQQGRPPLFSRFYLRQMTAEQLYDSLLAATRADATVKEDMRDALKQRWLSQFATAFGNDEGTEATTFNGSIPQALTMMNGELVARATRTGGGSFLAKIAGDPGLTDREKINYLYRAALARTPTREESKACNALLAARGGDVPETLADVWWAVLNSNEFILVH